MPSIVVQSTDGFDLTDSVLLQPSGSQVVASKSVLGVNIAVNPSARFRGKTAAEREAVSFLVEYLFGTKVGKSIL